MRKNIITKTIIVAALAALALGPVAYAQQNPPVSPSPVKRTILSKIDVPGTNYEAITATLEVAPGFKAGRHFHPGVVIGHVTVYVVYRSGADARIRRLCCGVGVSKPPDGSADCMDCRQPPGPQSAPVPTSHLE